MEETYSKSNVRNIQLLNMSDPVFVVYVENIAL